MEGLLLVHGTIVTVDGERRIIEDGALAISADRIVDIGAAEELMPRHSDKKVIDCRGKLIIPGLIDAHGHAGHALIRSIAADTNGLWMRVVTPTYYHFITRDFWYADGLVSGLERLRAGVTTGASIITSMPRSDDPVFAINHARAYTEIGLRGVNLINKAQHSARSSASALPGCPGRIPSRDGKAAGRSAATLPSSR